jgi:aminoglycoside phosphotransferase (APT) family kinase protein
MEVNPVGRGAYGGRVASDRLPAADTDARFAAIRRDEARLRPGVLALCRRPGLARESVTRMRLAAQLGAALAALHQITVPGLGPPDWARFVAGQRAGSVARQRARGLGEPWLAQIPDFLDSVRLPASPPVLLHTEVIAITSWPPAGRAGGRCRACTTSSPP